MLALPRQVLLRHDPAFASSTTATAAATAATAVHEVSSKDGVVGLVAHEERKELVGVRRGHNELRRELS